MNKRYSIFLFLIIAFISNVFAQKPDSSYYYKVTKEFFNQKKPEKNQYEEFEDVYEIIFLDTADLEVLPEATVEKIEKTDKDYADGVEDFVKKGGFVQRTPKETAIRFLDELGRNLSINKFQRELTLDAHTKLEAKVKITMQYYIHWSGKIAGVKLIRYSKESGLKTEKIISYLQSIDYKKYQVIPERHFNLAVNSVNLILIGFE